MKATLASGLLLLSVLPLLGACSSAPEPTSEEEAPNTSKKKCKGDDCDTGEAPGAKQATAPTAAPAPPAAAPVCVELTSCDALQAPKTLNPATDLNVGLAAISKEQLRSKLQAEVASGSKDARALAAALSARQDGESESVTFLRNLIQSNPRIAAALQRQVPSLGYGSMAVYQRRFPTGIDVNNDVGTATATKAPQVMEAPLPTAACIPSLKIRLAKITVHEDEDDWANDEIYCSISVASESVQELRITPKTRKLDEDESQSFTGEETVVWGQGRPREAKADLTVKYDCFEAESAAGYSALIKTAADAAKEYGNKVVSEENTGYVSTGADLLGAILPAVLALDSDDHLFVATQTIPVAKLMELAKGSSWTVKKKGSHLGSDWEWSLTMEAWGCAVNGTKQ